MLHGTQESESDPMNARRPIATSDAGVKILGLLVFLVLAFTVAKADVAQGHGVGSAVPSNGGAEPAKTHPWKTDYCTASPDGLALVYDFRHACTHHDGCYAGFPRADEPVYWAPGPV